MAKNRRKTKPRGSQGSQTTYWLWPFWPLVPVSRKQLTAAKKLVEARGEFWSESFSALSQAIGKISQEWGKTSPR
jgi:hypothetical protein